LQNDKPIEYGDSWANLVKNRAGSSEADRRRSASELEIERKLRTPVLPRYDNTPLAEVVEQLSQLTGVNIHLDPRGLGQEGVRSDAPVSLNLGQEVSLQSALNLILEPLHLTYMVKDEVLKITSEQLRDGDVYQKVYNVADLVIPIPNFVPSSNIGLQGLINDAYAAIPQNNRTYSGPVAVVPTAAGGPAAAGPMGPGVLPQQFGSPAGSPSTGESGPGGLGGAANADFDSLIDLIVSTVEHDSWMENGTGDGEIQPFPTNLSLVISQTQRVHEQIADLLEQLRRLQDLQVTIEVRFIRLTDSFFERIGIDFDFNIEDGSGIANIASFEPSRASATVGISANPSSLSDPLPDFTVDMDIPFRNSSFGLATPQFGTAQDVGQFGFAILSDIEAFFLINASQGDRRANVLQAPKVTLFNGQQAIVLDTSFRPFVISVIPVVGEFAAAQQPVIVVLSEGTTLTVQAVVSDDRRYVRLTLVPFFSQVGDVQTFTFEGSETSSSSSNTTDDDDDGNDETNDNSNQIIRSGTTVQLPTFQVISVSTTVSVPDGGTVLLGGIKRLNEGRTEFGVPLLSKVPYVDRLFRNVGIGRETDSLMMMVTPHIIIQEEEEERLGIE
jgi:general secretion pathway protein D